MKDINISKIISDKRREKGVTQEQLADYIGISKASVSKWETGQSYPDITFLPQLASYFNISIDDLMGYTPQMTKEDIKALYHKKSSDFSNRAFHEVWEECQEIIKKYYSCYPLLMQMAVLLCNHCMLAGNQKTQMTVLEVAAGLCEKIQSESGDIWLSKEAVSLEATCYLMMGQPQATIEILGETIRPLSNDDVGVAQAYVMLGDTKKADRVLQISIYQHLLILINTLVSLLQIENEKFEETLHRILTVAKVFHVDHLHPNTMAIAYLSAAQGYCTKGNYDQALCFLEKYTHICTTQFVPFMLHGDSFFNDIDSWFLEFDLGKGLPRSESVIKASMIQSLTKNPVFEVLKDDQRYKLLVRKLKSDLGGNVHAENIEE